MRELTLLISLIKFCLWLMTLSNLQESFCVCVRQLCCGLEDTTHTCIVGGGPFLGACSNAAEEMLLFRVYPHSVQE